MRSKNGRWKFFHYFWVPYDDESLGDGNYLDRLYVVECPWFSIMLHRIGGPDEGDDMHDHPWWFISLVPWGSYVERTVEGLRTIRWVNFKGAKTLHTIESLGNGKPVFSILFCGPRKRVWGFMTANGWQNFLEHKRTCEIRELAAASGQVTIRD